MQVLPEAKVIAFVPTLNTPWLTVPCVSLLRGFHPALQIVLGSHQSQSWVGELALDMGCDWLRFESDFTHGHAIDEFVRSFSPDLALFVDSDAFARAEFVSAHLELHGEGVSFVHQGPWFEGQFFGEPSAFGWSIERVELVPRHEIFATSVKFCANVRSLFAHYGADCAALRNNATVRYFDTLGLIQYMATAQGLRHAIAGKCCVDHLQSGSWLKSDPETGLQRK